MLANDRRLTIGEVTRRFARTPVTIARWVKAGILPQPIYINGTRAWALADILAAEERLRAAPRRGFPAAPADGQDDGTGAES
jgi:predicted DNA-binding transcriptional regulator AlpA